MPLATSLFILSFYQNQQLHGNRLWSMLLSISIFPRSKSLRSEQSVFLAGSAPQVPLLGMLVAVGVRLRGTAV